MKKRFFRIISFLVLSASQVNGIENQNLKLEAMEKLDIIDPECRTCRVFFLKFANTVNKYAFVTTVKSGRPYPQGKLWVIEENNNKNLVYTAHTISSLEWSPTGRYLCFDAKNFQEPTILHVYDTFEDSLFEIQPITDIETGYGRWSADETKIAYTEISYFYDDDFNAERQKRTAMIYEIDTNERKRLIVGDPLAWNARGEILILSISEKIGSTIVPYMWLFDLNKKEKTKKINLEHPRMMTLNRGGDKVVFEYSHWIAVYNLKTEEIIKFENDEIFEGYTNPSWSPDGKKIAFTHFEERDEVFINENVWLAQLDGDQMINLTDTGEGKNEKLIQWIRDGTIVIKVETPEESFYAKTRLKK